MTTKINRAALQNAVVFDAKKGGKTMPVDSIPADSQPNRLAHKQRMSKPSGSRTGSDERFKVKIAGEKYGHNFCLKVYKEFKSGIPRNVLADTYDLPKMVVQSIITKGEYGKL